VTTAALSRRQELGAASARSLLLTVLGELVLPAGGSAWTSALLDLLGDLDVEEKAARQALMRAATAGWIASVKEGRRTRWTLSSSGRHLLDEGARRIYGFAGAADTWDGRWLIVTVPVREGGRALRHRLRMRMGWAGFGSIGTVWISPWPEREDEVAQVLDQLGLATAAHSFVARTGGIGDARHLLDAAWDLAAIERRYQSFVDLVWPQQPRTDREALVHQVRLVQEWRRFPLLDPGLPRELLPAGWSGTRAAAFFRERHDAWAPGARRAWVALSTRSQRERPAAADAGGGRTHPGS
jgi:phenylacetic acid degradation operon negative regulatory protein